MNLKYKFINENGKEKIYTLRNYKIDVSDLRISNEISLQKIIDTRVEILIDRKNPRINAIGLDGLITKYRANRAQDHEDLSLIATYYYDKI